MINRAVQIKYRSLLVVAGIALLVFPACDQLSVKKSLDGHSYQLLDQQSHDITFPASFEGRVMLVGYVYTHCPDICPMITYNMRDIQRAFPDEERFMLVSISFDPDRDTPEMLYDYANNYRLDQNNWRLLTGEKTHVEELLKTLEISTVKTPTRFTEDQKPVYFIDHTDRVTLIDHKGNVRRTYPGSDLREDVVIEDIRKLLDRMES
jgi:protein SCO1